MAASAVSIQDQDRPVKRTCLGKIATAHGVRGLVKVLCEANDPQLLNGTLYKSETGAEMLTLNLKNTMGKYWLAEIDGISDRDDALALRGTELWIDRDKLPAIENDNEFYIADLVGLKVIDTEKKEIGFVMAVDNFGAGDLLEIQPLTGDSFYLPFSGEHVTAVDITKEEIEITPPSTD